MSDSVPRSRPDVLTRNSTYVQEFDKLGSALMREPAFQENGRSAITPVQGDHLRVTVTAMRSGASLKDHVAGRATQLVVLSGELAWSDESLPTPVRLPAGCGVSFGGGVQHSVSALSDTVFLLVFGSDDSGTP